MCLQQGTSDLLNAGNYSCCTVLGHGFIYTDPCSKWPLTWHNGQSQLIAVACLLQAKPATAKKGSKAGTEITPAASKKSTKQTPKTPAVEIKKVSFHVHKSKQQSDLG